MPMDRFLIAPFDENSGLTTNVRPWQIPDQAWATLNNAYVFRGRLRKRFGSRYLGSNSQITTINQLNSRLRVQVGTIGAPTSPVPGAEFNIGQMFSAGSQTFTVTQLGTPGAMITTGPGSGTFNTTTGAFVLAGTGLAGATPIYFYPSLPVMGLNQYEYSAINNYLSVGFDTQFAYLYQGGAWNISPGSPTWRGDDTDQFWATNWVGLDQAVTTLERVLFATNFHVVNPNGLVDANDDPMYYYNGTTWTAFTPYFAPPTPPVPPGAGPYVQTAKIIVPFHNRLLLINTVESDGVNNVNYVNRVRFSFEGSPFWRNAFYQQNTQDNAGGLQAIGTTAGFVDASTLEAIISVEFVKDRLILYFEESTWELAYQGNQKTPFIFQKMNNELGSMATFSTISFDKAIITVGETGIHSCNGSNVLRIDQKIPDQIFQISNPATETERICGVRDYFSEMVYWAVPEADRPSSQLFPSKVLVYNYQNKTWAFNDDCITSFGYFDSQPQLTWAQINWTWEEWNDQWSSGDIQENVRQVIAGNQQGYTFIIDTETSFNVGALQITTMTQLTNKIRMTIINHMLKDGDYIYIENAQGVTLNGNRIYRVQFVDINTIDASYPPEISTAATFTGTYTGSGTAARVSNYNIYSKQWNPYDKDGRNVYISKIDFAVEATTNGEITINYSPSSTPLSSVQDAKFNTSIMGTSVLETKPYPADIYPLEQEQRRLWHPVYFQVDGECIQINMYMSPEQICDPAIAFSDFQLEGLVIHSKAVSYRLQ